jgi:hypothetical protein
MKIIIEISNGTLNINYDKEALSLPAEEFSGLLEDSILLLKSQLLSEQYSFE